ncbi:MAG: DUF6588 family protein [candidate division WOR-3 bacterium]
MKKSFCRTGLATVLLLAAIAIGRGASPNPIELLTQVNDSLLLDYCRPLLESYSTAMATGLYHSAKSHSFLGFDLGARLMFVKIPAAAKTFTARVLACSANTKFARIDTFWVTVENAATIFGRPGIDTSFVPENGITIPPALPGGLGLPGIPFLVPQASVGLPIPGSELTIRYIPWPFQGTTVQFLGGALKQELTALPGLKLPFNIAAQAFFQKLTIGTAVNALSYGGNLHLSRGFVILTPYAGIGVEKTDMKFDYDFRFDAPVGYDAANNRIITQSFTRHIALGYSSGPNFRFTLGATLRLALFLFNLDYSYAKYPVINGGLAFGIR